MKRGEFIKTVEVGSYIYLKDKNKIVQVTRIFSDVYPAYAEYKEPDGTYNAGFYDRIQLVPKETLVKILNKRKNGETETN